MRRLLLALSFFALALAPPAAAAPGWLEPELPFGDASALSDRASAAMAPDGTVIVARLSPGGALEVRERPPGGPFGATITLERATEAPADAPDLQVLTSDGGAALVFTAANGVRVASRRTEGGRWTKPVEAFPAGGPVALGADAALWSVARSAAAEGRLAVYRLVGDGPPSFRTVPLTGDRQLNPALSLSGSAAHVAFSEVASVAGDAGQCLVRTKVRAVDAPAGGGLGHVQTLDQFDAHGQAAPFGCLPNAGDLLQAPLLLTAADDGSDTAVWTRLTLPTRTAKTVARYRESGPLWLVHGPPELIGDGMTGERLIGGPGDPVVVVQFEFGRLLATRGPGGWTTPAPLLGFEPFQASRTGTGSVAFAWVDGTDVAGRVFDPGVGLGDTVTIAPASPEAALLSVGADEEGNAVALTSDRRGDAFELRTHGYDAAGPRVTSLALPERPVAGVSELFSATGVDVWSGPARGASWNFGDGAVEDGLTRPHAYAAAGRRTVEVRLRDAVGNETSATAALDVAGAPAAPGPVAVPTAPPPPPRDTRAPRLTRVSVTPRRPHTARPGLLQLTTSEAGKVRVVLTKVARGIRSGGRCVIVKRPRGKKLCTRTVGRRTVTRTVAAGAGRVALPRLGAGTWKVRATVTDAAGNESDARALTVRVAR